VKAIRWPSAIVGRVKRILAIESSCDETAAAVVENETNVLSSVVASQLDTHGKYGGVVPEIASREHLRAIVPVVRSAMEQAHADWASLDAVAVTIGPGLMGSLLVGLTYAKAISVAAGLPLIGVHHVEGHIHAVLLEAARGGHPVELPALALVVSGGHTHLFQALGKSQYKLMGKTRDDAAGEAFDKVAKLLGFGYPGGPVVDQLAALGSADAVRFTRPQRGDFRTPEAVAHPPTPKRGPVARGDSAGDPGLAGQFPTNGDPGVIEACSHRRRRDGCASRHYLRRGCL
jgi:N6-L-threonylcarbamoyladenine synthase